MLFRSVALRPHELAKRAAEYIKTLANAPGCRVFTKALRYLFENLESLGYLSKDQRMRFDPWTPELCSIVKCPNALGTYDFVFVPAPASSKLSQAAIAAGASPGNGPFLLGVHEVTNEQFENFLLSSHGTNWSIDRVTRAGSGGSTSSSAFARLTNEYQIGRAHV